MMHMRKGSVSKDAAAVKGNRATAEPMVFPPLGTYFVEAGLLSQAQVEVVLNDQEMTGLRFGEILVQRGWMKEATIEYFVDKLIEPERRSLQKSMAWQKAGTPKKATHRKGFVTGPPAAPPTNRKAAAKGDKTVPLRPAAQHRKGFVKPTEQDSNADTAAKGAPSTDDKEELTTCTGLNRSRNYDEASESLVWIG